MEKFPIEIERKLIFAKILHTIRCSCIEGRSYDSGTAKMLFTFVFMSITYEMLKFKKARKIAEAWVEIVSDGSAEIDKEQTITRPYGWLFYWNSKNT